MSATRSLVGSVALLAMTVGLLTGAPVPTNSRGLVVHEWGTFTSFSGSDGVLQQFYPSAPDLPPFVYSTRRFVKGGDPATVSLETPVLYFYAGRPLTATVRARFPAGIFTEWFPQAQRSDDAKTLTWADVRFRPGDSSPPPTAAGATHYYAARAVPAAPIEVVSHVSDKEIHEHERFLFYRGAGEPKTPLIVRALGGGEFNLKVTGDAPLTAGLLMEVKAGKVRFRPIDPIPAKSSANVELPTAWGGVEPARTALVATLVGAGLFEAEAQAMVKTWESAWFADEGARVLYILPSSWTDRTLPLTVTPNPDTLLRVMVGRHDVLTPEREAEIDALVRRVKGPKGSDQAAAQTALAKLGRFASPAQRQAERRLLQTK